MRRYDFRSLSSILPAQSGLFPPVSVSQSGAAGNLGSALSAFWGHFSILGNDSVNLRNHSVSLGNDFVSLGNVFRSLGNHSVNQRNGWLGLGNGRLGLRNDPICLFCWVFEVIGRWPGFAAPYWSQRRRGWGEPKPFGVC